jgi:hypothetical protein
MQCQSGASATLAAARAERACACADAAVDEPSDNCDILDQVNVQVLTNLCLRQMKFLSTNSSCRSEAANCGLSSASSPGSLRRIVPNSASRVSARNARTEGASSEREICNVMVSSRSVSGAKSLFGLARLRSRAREYLNEVCQTRVSRIEAAGSSATLEEHGRLPALPLRHSAKSPRLSRVRLTPLPASTSCRAVSTAWPRGNEITSGSSSSRVTLNGMRGSKDFVKVF